MHQHETGFSAVQRLESDLRTLSPAGIERIAWGWRQHEAHTQVFHDAERFALHVLERADRGPAWEDLHRGLAELMEGSGSLLSWKEEHGQVGHTAERAVYGAALALLGGDQLPPEQYVALVRPLAEALPWLLPEAPPAPREARRLQ